MAAAAPVTQFKIDDALMIMTGRLRATSAKEKTFEVPATPTDLRAAAFLTAAAIPEDIPFLFTKFSSREKRRKLLTEPKRSSNAADQAAASKPVHVPYDTNIQPPAPLSPERRRILASKFKENMPPGSSNMVVLEAPRCEDNLPALQASITIQALDADDNDPTETLVAVPIVYDTGSQITIISADLLSPEFQNHLKSDPIHEPYTSPSGFVQISARICFTNVVVALEIVAVVRPADTMPNKFNGILLGQRSAIDSIVAEMVPRHFLKHLSEDLWGEIRISRVYDNIEEEIREY